MSLPINRIMQAHREGRTSYGTYMRTASPKMVEMLAAAGLDFVRIDLETAYIDVENLENMIKTAHLCGITPTVRVNDNDEGLIHRILNVGALGIIIPEVKDHREVAYAARALRLHPEGTRHAGPSTWLGGYGSVSQEAFLDWARNNTFLSVQVERKTAVDDIDEILKVPGLDMVQSGRGTLSSDLGLPSQFDPAVVAMESMVMEKAMAAGKMTSVQYYPMRDKGQLDYIRSYVAKGVSSISLGTDIDLVCAFREMLSEVKRHVKRMS